MASRPASDLSAFVTGMDILVDGGLTSVINLQAGRRRSAGSKQGLRDIHAGRQRRRQDSGVPENGTARHGAATVIVALLAS
jgi:hypothetical protein